MEKQAAMTRVQSLAESEIQTVPPQYVWPGLDLSKKLTLTDNFQAPIVDLHGLSIQHLKKKTTEEISSAAEKWGFFQIVNHGIPESLIARVQAVGKAFFDLPMEEKELYKNVSGGNPFGYGSKEGISADVRADWKDFYYNAVWPAAQRDMTKWPKRPSDFTEVMDEYAREICKLWEVLMQALSRGLGLENENTLEAAVGGERKEVHVGINYYPPCPQPELVLGVAPHTDVNALTILLHNQLPGLQIKKDNAWVDVQCIPGALVVNIGDQLEILSNGKYKSIEHRAWVHKDRPRMSWAMFGSPPRRDIIISPLKEVTDDNNPPLYEAMCFQDYVKRFFSKRLLGKDHNEELKNSPATATL